MTRPILFALAVLTLGAATPALAQEAMYDPCRSDDLVCRVDRLERTVAQMSERLSWYEGAAVDAAVAPATPPRSIDVPVNLLCGGGDCSAIAVRQCNTAGFPRGVPAEVSISNGFTYMYRVTCMD